MSRPEWWLNVVAERDIALAIQGAAPVEGDHAKAQLNQEDLAFNVLLQVAKYLRQREPVPDELADYLADAIDRAAMASRTYDAYRQYSKRVNTLLKELNFVRETSGPRKILRPAQVQAVVAHMKLLTAGDRSHMKSQQELADKLGISLSTVQRIWKKYEESSPDAE